MKQFIVGVLAAHGEEFESFRRSNPIFRCIRLRDERDLEGQEIDFFVRLFGWNRMDPDLLNVVKITEKMRGSETKEYRDDPVWTQGGFSPGKTIYDNLITPVHFDSKSMILPPLDPISHLADLLKIRNDEFENDLRKISPDSAE